MGALKNATIDRDDVIIPWPVRDYSPPIEEIDDAPPAEALSFREWMAEASPTPSASSATTGATSWPA